MSYGECSQDNKALNFTETAGTFNSSEGGLNYRPSWQNNQTDVEEEDSGLTAAVDRLHKELVRNSKGRDSGNFFRLK